MTDSVFYNGKEPWAKPVRVALVSGYVEVYDDKGTLQAKWAQKNISRLKAREAEGEFCLTSGGSARLLLRDKAIQEQLQTTQKPPRAWDVDKKILAYWLVGALGFGLFLWQGLPLLAKPLVALVPKSVDESLGKSAYQQMTSNKKLCDSKAGKAALNKLQNKILDKNAALKIVIVKSKSENAVALPGGYIVIFSGLLDRAHKAPLLAAVLAHEVGHIERRHGIERLVSTATLGLVAALLTGDVSILTLLIVEAGASRYTQGMEAEADAYAIGVMKQKGIDPKPLANWFKQMAEKKGDKNALSYFETHPHPLDRAAFFAPDAQDAWPIKEMLSAQDWVALKNICS